MSAESDFILIHCLECTQNGCVVACGNASLAFMHGEILIDTRKCGGCPLSGLRQGIPQCVADCKCACQKAIVTEMSVMDKRTRAVNALSLL